MVFFFFSFLFLSICFMKTTSIVQFSSKTYSYMRWLTRLLIATARITSNTVYAVCCILFELQCFSVWTHKFLNIIFLTPIEDPFILVEYCSMGNLQNFLRSSRAEEGVVYSNLAEGSFTLRSKDLLSFGWQVARGMIYLASVKVTQLTKYISFYRIQYDMKFGL